MVCAEIGLSWLVDDWKENLCKKGVDRATKVPRSFRYLIKIRRLRVTTSRFNDPAIKGDFHQLREN